MISRSSRTLASLTGDVGVVGDPGVVVVVGMVGFVGVKVVGAGVGVGSMEAVMTAGGAVVLK